MMWKTIAEMKSHFLEQGFKGKVILSDAEAEAVGALMAKTGQEIATPADELRYMEGLLGLPLGFIKEFLVTPKPGQETCACGRTPSALEIVAFAAKRGVHSKELIRDTIIGYQNILELAEGGRDAECLACARPVTFFTYRKKPSYAYV